MKTTFSLGIAAFALVTGGQAYAQSGHDVSIITTALGGTANDSRSASCGFGTYGTGAARCSLGGKPSPQTGSGSVSANGAPGVATYVTSSVSGGGGGAGASNTTTVDLATASIRMSSIDTSITGNCSSQEAPCGSTNAFGRFADTLHFSVAGAQASTITPITVTFSLDGTLRSLGQAIDNNGNGELFGSFVFGGDNARFDLKNNAANGYTTEAGFDQYPFPFVDGVWTTNGDHSVNTFTGTYNLLGATRDVGTFLSLNLTCSVSFQCDFGHTAKVNLILPTGTSFTSDSGVFLTGNAPVAGVPEPATWAMMLIGFAAIGGATRGRKRSRGVLRLTRAPCVISCA